MLESEKQVDTSAVDTSPKTFEEAVDIAASGIQKRIKSVASGTDNAVASQAAEEKNPYQEAFEKGEIPEELRETWLLVDPESPV